MALDPNQISSRRNSFDIQRLPGATPRPGSRFDDARRLAGAEQAARNPGTRDPFDLGVAFGRLKKLLAMERDTGPRRDVPQRGFYLNILV